MLMPNVPESETIDPLSVVRSDHGCFGCGDENPIGLHLRFAADGDSVRASITPGPDHQGFGGIVHGGIICTLFDEAMAWATARVGYWAMTGDMRVRFRRPLLVGEPTVVAARVSGARGHLITTAGELVLESDGSQIATATATFVKVDPELEAAWRARYLRESDPLLTELRDVPNQKSAGRAERARVGLLAVDALAPENEP